MKIISPFTDYYDNISAKNQSLIYKRETKIETDVAKKYKDGLLRASIGIGMSSRSFIHIDRYLNQTSRLNYISVTPTIVGIAGRMFFFVDYENSMLFIKKRYYDYASLKSIFKNSVIESTFNTFNTAFVKTYCYNQFKCVNFIMWMEDTLHIVKEPNLEIFGLHKFLSSEECYENIDKFFKNKVENNKKYKIKGDYYAKQLD
jgi:hypothetical protein